MCINIYTYIYIYMHTYIHTYIHTYVVLVWEAAAPTSQAFPGCGLSILRIRYLVPRIICLCSF